jgi:hypothetical protein
MEMVGGEFMVESATARGATRRQMGTHDAHDLKTCDTTRRAGQAK